MPKPLFRPAWGDEPQRRVRFGSCASLLLPVISVAALIAAACTSSATPSVAPASSGAIVRTELGTTLPSNAPGQRLGLWHYTIPAGQALVPHRHPGWQIARITSGTLTYTILTGTVTVVRGGGAQETHGAGETIKLNAGDTVIEVRRAYRLSSGAVAEVALNLYPADRFELSMTLRRSKA